MPQRGRLLVASPPLVDPNFDRTVVYLLEHADDGTVGVIINRPTDTDLDDVLPEWRPLAGTPAVVFEGGPVSRDGAIALARAGAEASDGYAPLVDGIGTVQLDRDPLDLGAPCTDLRVFSGYAGWSPGQLEAEIEQGGWWVADGSPDDVFSDTPAELWRTVVRRQRGSVALFANYPDDATVN